MIHFARPNGGGSFCGQHGDIRYMDGKWPKKSCCTVCWSARMSLRKTRRKKSSLGTTAKRIGKPALTPDAQLDLVPIDANILHGFLRRQRVFGTNRVTHVPCNFCGAAVGSRCTTKSVDTFTESSSHRARLELYRSVSLMAQQVPSNKKAM